MHRLALVLLQLLHMPFANATDAVSKVQVYAHRGVRSYLPENTMVSYQEVLRIGTDWVDMDIAMSKDGEIVVTHDPVMNPDLVRDSSGQFLAKSKESLAQLSAAERAQYNDKYAISHMTVAEIQQFDVGRLNLASSYARFFPKQKAVDGQKMPTLREVIRYVKAHADERIGFQIEMKTDPGHPEFSADPVAFSRALYRILSEEGIVDRSEIQAFDFRCLRELIAIDGRVKTAFLTSRDNEPGGADDFFSHDLDVATRWTGGPLARDYGSIPKMVKALGGYAWEPEDAQLTRESLAEAHRLGLKVVVWSWPEMAGTAFDAKMAQKMIDWRVDGIITDDPGRLNRMLERQGLPVPPKYDIKK